MSNYKKCDICNKVIVDGGCDSNLSPAEIIIYGDETERLDVHVGCLLKHCIGKLKKLVNENSYVFCPTI